MSHEPLAMSYQLAKHSEVTFEETSYQLAKHSEVTFEETSYQL